MYKIPPTLLPCALLAVVSLVACTDRDHSSIKIAEQCKNLESECPTRCVAEKFNTCYIDTKMFPNGPYDMVNHCYATHVGRGCFPCTHHFSLSFGGSLREISCEEFLAGMAAKNKRCDNCLTKYGESNFSF